PESRSTPGGLASSPPADRCARSPNRSLAAVPPAEPRDPPRRAAHLRPGPGTAAPRDRAEARPSMPKLGAFGCAMGGSIEPPKTLQFGVTRTTALGPGAPNSPNHNAFARLFGAKLRLGPPANNSGRRPRRGR